MEGTYYIRISNHIQEDLTRNWSSWNYGSDGFKGTREELVAYIERAIEGEYEIFISSMETIPTSIEVVEDDVLVKGANWNTNYTYRQLYPNYWVAVDSRFDNSLACSEIGYFETYEEFLLEKEHENTNIIDSDGVSLPVNAVLVESFDNYIHIFCVPE